MSVLPISKKMFADLALCLNHYAYNNIIGMPKEVKKDPKKFVSDCEKYHEMTFAAKRKDDVTKVTVTDSSEHKGEYISDGQILKSIECISYNIDIKGWMTTSQYDMLPFKEEYENFLRNLNELEMFFMARLAYQTDEYQKAKWSY